MILPFIWYASRTHGLKFIRKGLIELSKYLPIEILTWVNEGSLMHWVVASPFFSHKPGQDRWLDDFVPVGNHTFSKVLTSESWIKSSWHNQSKPRTPLGKWANYWEHSGRVWREAQDGVITLFPQIAAMVGLRKRFSRKKVPIVAWCYNIGRFGGGLLQKSAKFCNSSVDRFIVHSTQEVETVSKWLKLPKDRFIFVPLQRAEIPITQKEDKSHPFVLAMGSANRDYATFFDAIKITGLRTIVVAGAHAIKGLTPPSNVEIRNKLSPDQCHELAQKARINVVPLLDHVTAAGQVTIIEAMRMYRPVIATRCAGSVDYIENQKTGILVPPNSSESLAREITDLWNNEDKRNNIAKQAGDYAETHLSDQVAGENLKKVLDQFLRT